MQIFYRAGISLDALDLMLLIVYNNLYMVCDNGH